MRVVRMVIMVAAVVVTVMAPVTVAAAVVTVLVLSLMLSVLLTCLLVRMLVCHEDPIRYPDAAVVANATSPTTSTTIAVPVTARWIHPLSPPCSPAPAARTCCQCR